jgi:flagellar protein FliO/FliZ
MMLRFIPALAIALCLAAGPAPARQAPPATAAGEVSAPAASAAPSAPAPAVTAPAARPPALQPAYGGASAGNLLQTIFGLCVVLGLLALLAWFLKRYGPKAAAGSAGLRIVGALNLGGRERIMVVEVGEQWIVVGASPGRVNALATMPRQALAEQPAALQPHRPPAASFSEWLKQTIDQRNAK